MTFRRTRSFMSTTRFQKIFRESSASASPCTRWLSTIAASRLWAAPTAWMSPMEEINHRRDLRATAAGRATLGAEDRPGRGLGQRDERPRAELAQAVGKTD